MIPHMAKNTGCKASPYIVAAVLRCAAVLCRARRRTSGFRTRMQTKTGRRVLKLRRKKGRKNICPASTRSSAGKKQ